ncbi:hypothetical protein JOB18_016791 [Solea senegalensis]|uniref:Arrestin C-terminal-like domain-containing protein n=1 Tax=Solea senegalensis TaxID=28829 RepID=A0AAV6QHN3_SOLSE|nr:arrestin domain-containing protein 3-like [Solea senegalensis]KAG7489631.1 hypothetical protein JOB18_016791 [Solea senegalensis]
MEDVGARSCCCLFLVWTEGELTRRADTDQHAMSSTVKSLKVTYDPPNESDTFRVGDWVTGRVTLEVAKECHISSLRVKFKGKARVLWTERYGQTTVVYQDKDKYFSLKNYFIREEKSEDSDEEGVILSNQNGETYSSVVAPGCHSYPFTFQFPLQNMPSSFKGSVGKIVYLLEAKLSRSMRIPTKDTAKLKFVTNEDCTGDSELRIPQHESKDKKMKLFNSGTVAMDVDIEKTGFFQGEGLKVVAHIQNNSTRPIKPKFCLYKKNSYFAGGKRRLNTDDFLKEVGDPIPPSSKETVTRIITIPHDVEPSIHNCRIIKAEHRLRVYLDVKYASDPEIKFPVVILAAPEVPAVAPPAAAAFAPGFAPGFQTVSYGTPGPAAWGFAPPQLPPPAAAPIPCEPPPPYGAHGMYPPLTDFGNKY